MLADNCAKDAFNISYQLIWRLWKMKIMALKFEVMLFGSSLQLLC